MAAAIDSTPLSYADRRSQSGSGSYYLQLADEFRRSGHAEPALRYFARAVQRNPELPAPWLGQVEMLLELSELGQARTWADKALEIHSDHPDLLAAKAVVCARLGDTDQALSLTHQAVQASNASSFAWIARGEALLAGERTGEDYCFTQAVTVAGEDWFVCSRIARVLCMYGEHTQALDRAGQAVARAPETPYAWHVLGECESALGMDSAAVGSFEKALRIDSSLEQAR
ncbi:tetratricopeptide repeat protein, partial [Planctomycetota bacterium]